MKSLNKLREQANYYFNNYDEYIATVVVMELDWMNLSNEELEAAIERIKYVYNHVDYATIQGAATSYGYWLQDLREGNLELEEGETEEDNWKTWYSYSDWR